MKLPLLALFFLVSVTKVHGNKFLYAVNKPCKTAAWHREISSGNAFNSGSAFETYKLIDVTGTVMNAQSQPLQGSSVFVRKNGHKIATITNEKGRFTFTNIPDTCSVTISHVGYRSRQLHAASDMGSIVLETAVDTLNEVQVATISTGYQHLRAEQVTGAVSQITTKAYESSINPDFLSGLQGKLTGLLINNDVKFQRNNLFQIRGLSTMTGNARPLVVIDGYPSELSLSDINPNEIKSVTILKDAAAAAIYGVRGSNGVIIVERKEAKEGAPQIAFRTTLSLTPKENYSRYRWVSENDYVNFLKYTETVPQYVPAYQQIQFGALYSPGLDILSKEAAGILTPAEASSQLAALGSYNNTKDYSKLFTQTALNQTYNIDVSGGNPFATYYLTGNYSGGRPSQVDNSNRSVQLSGRLNINFSPRFSMRLITDYNERVSRNVPVPGIDNFYPTERFKDAQGNPLPSYYNNVYNQDANAELMALGYQDNTYYPLDELKQEQFNNHTTDNHIETDFTYKIGAGFNLDFGGVYENSHAEARNYYSGRSYIVRSDINTYAAYNDDYSFHSSPIPAGGYLQDNTTGTYNYTLRAQLNYEKHIGKDHFFSAILGTEVRDIKSQGNNYAAFGYNDQTLLQIPVNYALLEQNNVNPNYFDNVSTHSLYYPNLFDQAFSEDRFVSGYANGIYEYKKKYSLTGSIRVDQSNLFGTDPKFRYKSLWSLGFAWNISREDFLKNIDWLNSLKLRVANGLDGNISKVSIPQVVATSNLNKYTYPAPTPDLELGTPANGGLRWEKTDNLNIGLDWTIFKNISGSIDYYDKKSTNLLGNTQTDPTKGVTYANLNTSSIDNKGIELSLHADWISRPKFNWNTGLIISRNASKVLESFVAGDGVDANHNAALSSDNYLNEYDYYKGYPVDAVFTYRNAGLDHAGVPLIFDKNGHKKTPGVEDDGLDDIAYSGSGIPVLNIGMSNRIDIGKFYVSCMLNYYGGFLVRVPRSDMLSAARPLAGSQNFWKKPGDEEFTDLINPYTLGSLTYREYVAYTNENTVSGDYITLSNLTGCYNLGTAKVFKKMKFSNFQLLVQGSNLYTRAFNKYNYSLATGGFAKSYITPTYTLGIYMNF